MFVQVSMSVIIMWFVLFNQRGKMYSIILKISFHHEVKKFRVRGRFVNNLSLGLVLNCPNISVKLRHSKYQLVPLINERSAM